MIDNTKEYIICSAVWYDDGKKHDHQPKNIDTGIVVCGRRHHNCFITIALLVGDIKNINKAYFIKHGRESQGFLTSKDRYVNRKEAFKIAKEAGQLNIRFVGIEDLSDVIDDDIALFSEDIY